jgi:AmiR/NasT family two-component response regulator
MGEADQPSTGDRPYVVAQATGVVVAQLGLNPDDALDELLTVARERGLSIYELAREVVDHKAL